MYDITVTEFIKMLGNLSAILDKGSEYATTKKFDVEVLLGTRLAPDQFPLVRQVQIACDTAKLGAARMTGVQAPVHDDTEKTLPELQARIASTIAFLQTVPRDAYDGLADRRVSQPRWEGKSLSAREFAIHHVIPNFFFHVSMAYAILRANGVDVGKRDYLGPMPFRAADT
jgi:hypothetical protein